MKFLSEKEYQGLIGRIENLEKENEILRTENKKIMKLAEEVAEESKSAVRASENSRAIAENEKAEMQAKYAKLIAEKQFAIMNSEPNEAAFVGVSCLREKEENFVIPKAEDWI